MRSWYAAKTKPRLEDQTGVVLGQRGIEVYLPKIKVRKGVQLRGAAKLEPLFPGYLFAQLDVRSQDWLLARSAPGISYFLGSDGTPTPLPEELVDGIRVREEAFRRNGWRPHFRSGDRVLISDGPLAGLEAVFDGTMSASGRSRVFVTIVSRLVPVVVADHLLRRTG